MEINQIIHGDNLEVMRKLNNRSIDLIYADPPFNTRRDFGEFNDQHSNYMGYMEKFILLSKDKLKNTGSIYLHCDSNESHQLKLLLDDIFGKDNFKNDIIWRRSTTPRSPSRHFTRNIDFILFYSKSKKNVFNAQYGPLSEVTMKAYRYKDEKGVYLHAPMDSPSGRGKGYYYDLGYGEKTPLNGYRMPKATMIDLIEKNLVVIKPNRVPQRKFYLKDSKGSPIGSIWTDIKHLYHSSKERKCGHYPTQKPLKLLKRIISASSNPGDLVLDPFCGSGTTLVAAKLLGRNYIGIDINRRAIEITNKRLQKLE